MEEEPAALAKPMRHREGLRPSQNKRRRKAQPVSLGLWLGLGGGAVVVVAAIVAAIVFLNRPKNETENKYHQADLGATPPTSKKPDDEKKQADQPETPSKFLHLKGQDFLDSMAFSPDGRKLATSGMVYGKPVANTRQGKGAITIWNLATGKAEVTLDGRNYGATQLAFSPDGKLLATYLGSDHELLLWDWSQKRVLHKHRFKDDSLGSAFDNVLQFSPNGKILTCLDRNMLLRMDVSTGRITSKPVETNLFTLITISPDDSVVISGPVREDDGSFKSHLFVGELDKPVSRTIPIPNTPRALAFSYDGRTFVVATGEGPIMALDTVEWKERATLEKKSDGKFIAYDNLRCAPNGAFAVAIPQFEGKSQPAAEVWQVGQQQTVQLGVGFCRSFAISQSSRIVAVSIANEDVKFFDPLTGKEKSPLQEDETSAPSITPKEQPTSPDQAVEILKALKVELIRNTKESNGPFIMAYLYGTELTPKIIQAFKDLGTIERLNLPGVSIKDGLVKELGQIKTLRHIHIGTSRISAAVLKEIKHIPQLESLNLDGESVTDDVLREFKVLKNLETLRLSGNGFTDAGISELKDLPKLRTLELSGRKFTTKGLKEVVQLETIEFLDIDAKDQRWQDLEGIKSLKTLKILHIRAPALKGLGRLTQLRELSLDDLETDDAGLEELEPLSKLQSLLLAGRGFTGSGLKHLTKLPDLKKLSLQCGDMTDDGLQVLKNAKELEELQIRGNQVTDRTLKSCQGMTKLRTLRLSGEQFRGEGLKEWKSLEKLGLGEKGFSDIALREVKELIKLRYLILLDTSVTDDGLKDLEQLSQLEHLTLSGSKATQVGISRLQKALPKAEITIKVREDEL